jgi:hypothetical protein
MGVDPHAQLVEEQVPRTYKIFETSQIQEQLQRLLEMRWHKFTVSSNLLSRLRIKE